MYKTQNYKIAKNVKYVTLMLYTVKLLSVHQSSIF